MLQGFAFESMISVGLLPAVTCIKTYLQKDGVCAALRALFRLDHFGEMGSCYRSGVMSAKLESILFYEVSIRHLPGAIFTFRALWRNGSYWTAGRSEELMQ